MKLTIAGWRAERRMSQTQLAEAIGVSQKTISKWEHNDPSPRLDDVEKMRDALKLKATDYIVMAKD